MTEIQALPKACGPLSSLYFLYFLLVRQAKPDRPC